MRTQELNKTKFNIIMGDEHFQQVLCTNYLKSIINRRQKWAIYITK